MFKVECPGCQAPYQVDERRVPAAGLRMRCPKCGATFRVSQPGASSPTVILDAGAATAGPAEAPPRKVGKGTMIGVAAQSDAPRPAPPPPRDRKKFAGTVIGVPAPQRLDVRPPATEDDDLPAILSGKPSIADLPTAKAPLAASPAAPPAAAKPKAPSLSLEDALPVPRAAQPAPKPAAAARPTPGAHPKQESAELSLELGDDLPVTLKKPPAGATASRETSLRMEPTTLPRRGSSVGARPTLSEPPPFKEPPQLSKEPQPFKDLRPSKEQPKETQRDSLELPSPAKDFGSELAAGALSFDGGAFGEIDLPVVSAADITFESALAPSRNKTSGFSPAAPSLPPSNPFAEAFSLPELEAPKVAEQRTTSFSASYPGFETNAREAERKEAPRDALGAPPSDFDELTDNSDFGTEAATAPAAKAKGGTQYGEVDLGGGGGFDEFDESPKGSGLDTDDGMEFGAIPQEPAKGGNTAEAALGAETAPTSVKPLADAVRVEAVPQKAPPQAQTAPKKRRWWLLAGALFVACVAGGALALVPAVGPFGVYFFSDLMSKSSNEQRLRRLHAEFEKARSEDTLESSLRVLQAIDSARAQVPRYQPLAAYLAFAEYSHVLRFGADSALRAKAKVLLDGVAQAGEAPTLLELRLARAAQAAVDGDYSKAKASFLSLSKTYGKSLETWAVRAEVELLSGDAAAAKQAFEHALGVAGNAWTRFGLARAEQALAASAAAQQLAEQVLKDSPAHNGARLLLAEVLWQSKDETAALRYAEEVGKPEAKASRGEQLLARTLLAEIHLGRGRLSKAETEFEAALALDPKNYRALSGLGDTFFEAGRYTAALARYEAAVTSDEKPVRAQLGVATAQLSLERVLDALNALGKLQKEFPKDARVAYWLARAAETSGKRDVAKEAYSRAIAEGGVGPDAARAYVGLAQLLRQEGQLDEAANLLKQALSRLPESALLRKAMGDVAISLGRYEQALAEFQAARDLDKADVTALFNVGSCLRRLNRFDEALSVFNEVAKLDQDLPGLPLERGLLLEQSGRTEEALKEYESALAKAPEDPDLMLRVGCSRVAAGDGKGGQPILQKVLEKRPRSAETHHCLGRAFFLQDKFLEALQSLQRATELEPNRAEYFVYVAWVANAAGQVALAEQAIDAALARDQGLGDAYWQKGVLLLRQGAALDAVAAFDKALGLRPSRYEIHADRAQAYYQLGKEVEALAEWQAAIKEEGDNPTWLFRYGKLLAARRMNKEALPNLKKAIELGAAREPKPAWLWQAYQLMASSLGPTQEALPYWRKFLEQSPEDSPYRDDAKRALSQAGQAWNGP